MNKTFPFLLFFYFLFISNNYTFAQYPIPGVQWQKYLGGINDDKANDILINPDGTSIVIGSSKSNDGDVSGHHGTTATNDAWVVKLDTAGNIIWQHSYGGSGEDYFTKIIATTDNDYLCIGYSDSNDGDVSGNHGGGDIWIVKINSQGAILWSRCYGGSKYDIASDAVLNGGYYGIIGTSNSYDGNVLSGVNGRVDADAWVFKINNSGDIQWERCLNYKFNMLLPDLHIANDVGYNITSSEDGNFYAYASGSFDFIEYNYFYDIDTVVGNYGILWKLDKNTGDSSQIARTTDRGRNYSMCKGTNGYYFFYTLLAYQPSPWNCDNVSFASSYKPNGNDTIIYKHLTTAVSCYNNDHNFVNFSSPHGCIAEDNSYVGVGIVTGYNNDFPAMGDFGFIANQDSWPNGHYQRHYDGDNFTSLKISPSGRDYLVAGYSVYVSSSIASHGGTDFWVVRLNGLNKVVGNVFLDANNNNIQDAGELPFNNAVVKTTKQSFQTGGLVSNGYYSNALADTGTYVTSATSNNSYYTAMPVNKTSVFTTYKNTDTANFAMHGIPGIKDYTVSAVSLLRPRPGFNLQYKIIYTNYGTTTLNNKDVVFIKDPRTSFLGATPAYTSISGDTVKWNIVSLSPTVSGTIILNLQLGNIPQVNIGDVLVSNVSIDSIGDYTPSNNYFLMHEQVFGSYDPNDKKESNAGEIYPPYISAGKFLNYTVRFQNSGNDTAYTLIVRDTLDSKLNGDSIEIISASHVYSANVKDKKYLTVTFNNIKLVDSIHNEPLSHGYFNYRIKPFSTVVVGDTIRNSASIYFDFNPPIKTNTEITFLRPTPTTNLWTGAVSTAWEDPFNWGNHIIPDENTNVLINDGLPRYPIINSNAVCRSMQTKTGTNILVKNGFTLRVMH
ncbi:MAG: hypothetical protein ABI402_02380 [Ferruginibacter sp.]